MYLLWVNRLSNRRALYMHPHSCCTLDCLSIQWTSLSVSLSLSLSPSHTLTGYPVWVSPHVIRINCGISRTASFFHIRLLQLCLQKCCFFFTVYFARQSHFHMWTITSRMAHYIFSTVVIKIHSLWDGTFMFFSSSCRISLEEDICSSLICRVR